MSILFKCVVFGFSVSVFFLFSLFCFSRFLKKKIKKTAVIFALSRGFRVGCTRRKYYFSPRGRCPARV
jgi:Gpi18-like mannosyltransferase